MAGKPLSRADAQKTLSAVRAAGGNQSHAAKALGIATGTIASRIANIRSRFPEFEIPPGGKGGNPQVGVAERTIDDHVKLHRSAAEVSASRARLKDAVREISELKDKISGLEWAGNVSLKPAEWTLDKRVPKGKSPHIPLLFFSDAQAGEIVRGEEMDTPWDYNSEIFVKRYRKMISITCDLATNHGGTRWSYPGIIYARGGDNISGGLHEDLRELGEDKTAVQQAELVAEEEAGGIRILADTFGRVEVETPGAAGNHDRITHKPPTKLAWARSYDRLIHKMLTLEFKHDKRVSFHISRSPDIRFKIFEKNVLLSHGDKIGSRGGMGFVGPGATILRGWQKLLMEQTQLGYIVDLIMTGHFHYPMALPIGFANGSFTGSTEYGKSFRMAPQAPMQYLSFHHHEHGCVDTRQIFLA